VNPEETGPWEAAIEQLRAWDPSWADVCLRMTVNPWRSGILPRRLVELISVGLNAACTNLNPDGTRRHIRRALHAGATREEILFVLKCAAVMSIHSCSLGAPIVLEEAKTAGLHPPPAPSAWQTSWRCRGRISHATNSGCRAARSQPSTPIACHEHTWSH
jgi:alkylhydroperoxidase/carboxymuconolactone decarboxylase family protein YurZ